MKKVKMLFVAVALLLVTAGVFAGKNKFADALYIYNPTSGLFTELASSVTFFGTNWSTSGTVQATTIDNTSTTYDLYYSNSLSDKIYVTVKAN